MPADFASEKNYSIGAMALTWVKESSGGGVTTRYTLSYDSNGGTQYKDCLLYTSRFLSWGFPARCR